MDRLYVPRCWDIGLSLYEPPGFTDEKELSGLFLVYWDV